MSFYIRTAKPEDLPQIVDILIQCWQTQYSNFLPVAFLSKLDSQKQLVRHQKYMDKGTPYWVANQNDQILGFTSYGPARSEELQSDMELYTLYVDPNSQGQGIGTSLLQAVFDVLKEKHVSLSVEVMAENPFRIFYEMKGFIVIGETEMDLGLASVKNLIYKIKL